MERPEALKKGLKFYNTGRPCKRDHESDRRSDNGDCLDCRKEIFKKKYDETIRSNPEGLRKHMEKIRAFRERKSRERFLRKKNIEKTSETLRKEYEDELGR